MDATELLSPKRVLVLGDMMLDRYTWGRAERVSPEAPVLVLKAENLEVRLGGAAAVAGLLRGLDSEVLLAGVVGDDPEGRTVRRLVDEAGIDGRLVQTDADRPTTHKHRVLASVEQRQPHQILRLDHERTEFLTPGVSRALGEAIERCAGLCLLTAGDQVPQESERPALGGFGAVGTPAPNGRLDVVLISDYAKGVCTPELLARVIGAAREQGIPVAVDPARIDDYERYRGAPLVKPNRREAELVTGRAIHSATDALEAGRELVRRYGFQSVVVTLDGDGMALVTADGLAEHVPTRARQVCDITGAGDMALAVLGLCLASGVSLRRSVEWANAAAGLEVERVGVAPVTWREIAEAVELGRHSGRRTEHRDPVRRRGTTKRLTLDEMARLAAGYRREGKTVVFTNGCFDLLHVGHVGYLEEAADLGDVLVVAVNSDTSVRRLGKGLERPIVPEADRAAMLAALACVDHVLVFEDDTPHPLLEAIRPDVLVKGGTYTVEQVVGHEVVERYGGRVCVTGVQPGASTTRLVDRIRRRCESRGESLEAGN